MTKKLPLRSRHCAECGIEFRLTNTRSRHCSRACYQRTWYRQHPGYMVEAQRRHLQKPEKRKQREDRMKIYRARLENKQRAQDLQHQRYAKNPEPVKARVRARYQGYTIGHTPAEWRALKDAYHHRCVYCRTRRSKLTKDHIIPISKGDPLTVDRIGNIVPSCKSCNSKKNNKLPPDFQPVFL